MIDNEVSKTEKIFSRAFVFVGLLNVCAFMGWQMLLTGLPVYLSQLDATGAEIGLLSTVAMVGSIICRPFIGVMVDRYGRSGFLVGGLALIALCCFGYAAFPLVGAILTIRFFHGIAWALTSTSCSTIVADILPKKRFAEGMGYFSMTGSLSLALGPALAMWLAESGHSQLMVVVAGGLTIVSIVFALAMVLLVYKQPAPKKDKPLKEAFRLSNMFEKSALFPSLIQGMLALGFICISTFMAVMGMERGIDNLSLYFVIYAVVNVLSRPLLGRWADRKGFFLPGILGCIFCALSFALIGLANAFWMIALAGVFIGLGMGTAMSVFNSMSVSTVPPASRGAATSTNLFMFNGGMAVGAVIGGGLVEAFGYTIMFLCMAGIAILAAIVFVSGGRERIDAYHVRQHQ